MASHRLLHYLCTLPAAQIAQVFEHDGCGQAVFRLLPPTAKHVVLRLAFVDAPTARGAPPGRMARRESWNKACC